MDTSSVLSLLGTTDAELVVTRVYTCKLWYGPRRKNTECYIWAWNLGNQGELPGGSSIWAGPWMMSRNDARSGRETFPGHRDCVCKSPMVGGAWWSAELKSGRVWWSAARLWESILGWSSEVPSSL